MLWSTDEMVRIVKQVGAGSPEKGCVVVEDGSGRTFSSADGLWQYLIGLGCESGWLMTTSRVVHFLAGGLPDLAGKRVLAGELKLKDGRAVHVDFEQGGEWSVRTLKTDPDASGVVTHHEYIVDGDPGLKISYCVGWSEVEAPQGPRGVEVREMRPTAFKFDGFRKIS